MSAQAQTITPKRGRGRPPKTHDNRRVQAYLMACGLQDRGTHFAALPRHIPWLADLFRAAECAQTQGQNSNGTLNGRLIFGILLSCSVVGAAAIVEALPRDYSPAQLGRYALASEFASQQIARHLDQCPKVATPDYQERVSEYFSL